MKTSVFFSGILSSLLLLSSCQRDVVDTSTWLHVDAEEVIRLESGTSETIIPVSSSYGQWAVTSNADWLSATEAGDNLVLQAKANESLSTRRAQVIVVSSGIRKALQIEQSGYPTLEIKKDLEVVQFSEDEGMMRLILNTNAEYWTVDNIAEDWIEVNARPRVGELVVKVLANPTTTPREVDVHVLSSGKTATIKVKQEGKIHFYLPMMEWGTDFATVEKMEKARKAKLAGIPSARTGTREYTFFSPSQVLPEIKYEFENYGDKNLFVAYMIGDRNVLYGNEFHEYLVSQGFTRVSPMNVKKGVLVLYRNEEKKTELSIYSKLDKQKKVDVGVVFCRYIHKQTAPQPTMASFDPGFMQFGDVTGNDILAWEQKNRGYFDEQLSRVFGGIPFFFVEDPLYARGYIFGEEPVDPAKPKGDKKNVLKQYIMIYLTYKLGIYHYADMIFLTDEFKELLKREGYEFWQFDPMSRAYFFKHTGKRIYISIKTIDVPDKKRMRINVYPMPNPKPTTSSQASGLASEIVSPNQIDATL